MQQLTLVFEKKVQKWIAEEQEMEKVVAIGKSHVVFQLIRNTGPTNLK